jgi:acyl-CoA thioesterase YciA
MWPYTSEELDALTGPRGELEVRTVAMLADTNPAGEIFGGWIMALMDTAGMIAAARMAQGRVVTVAVTDMAFIHPVRVGDVVCCYADFVRLGTSSATFHIEVWALRAGSGSRVKVTDAEFKFVALDANRKPRAFVPEAAVA